MSEGFLKENAYGYEITHKGRTIMREGEFLRKYRRKLKRERLAAIGVVSTVVAAILALITLCLQCR